MARLPNTATKAERLEVHKAKMAGKVYDRERRFPEKFDFRNSGVSRSALKRMFGIGSIARVNRHTGKPHEHAREIVRRARQAVQIDKNREFRNHPSDPNRSSGYIFAAGIRMNFSRRGNLVVAKVSEQAIGL